VADGVKLTLTVQPAPAPSEAPQVELAAKSPLAAIVKPVMLAAPTLVSDTVCAVLVVPVPWLGKVRVAGLSAAMGRPAPNTVSDRVALPAPPAPLQVNVYALTPNVAGATTMLPLVVCAPLQAPLAVHAVALLLLQVSVDVPPRLSSEELAVNVTTGAGAAVTVTVVAVCTLPPEPVQARE
jgi:hypothetical protein